MAGRITASQTQLRPDPRYGDLTLSKFVNCVMQDGKKTAAMRCVYGALDLIDARLARSQAEDKPENALQVFHMAVDNVKPRVEVRSKRVGGANYQVPMNVKPSRAQSLAFRWIIEAARKERGRPMSQKLCDELVAAAKREGSAMTTRENIHRMADANKAFAHFAK